MPKVNWGIDAETIDEFDRESQYSPYAGPTPPSGVYKWSLKVLKFIPRTRDKNAQLRVGLALVPRDGQDKKQYAGYFIMAFLPVKDNTAFRYVPFLDAIGVSGDDFVSRTLSDEDGNIKRIGQWRNNGETEILAELKDGFDQDKNPRKDIGWIGPLADEDEEEESADYDDEEAF